MDEFFLARFGMINHTLEKQFRRGIYRRKAVEFLSTLVDEEVPIYPPSPSVKIEIGL